LIDIFGKLIDRFLKLIDKFSIKGKIRVDFLVGVWYNTYIEREVLR